MNHNREEHVKLTLFRKCRHAYIGENQELSSWTYDPLYTREIMPGTEKLANYPELLNQRSWDKTYNHDSKKPALSPILFAIYTIIESYNQSKCGVV